MRSPLRSPALWLSLCFCFAVASAASAEPLVTSLARLGSQKRVKNFHAARLLLEELNCIACHDSERSLAAKQAPVLTDVSTRVRAAHLRKFLADPSAVKPGTTMPNVWKGVPPEEREARVEALVHYLVSLGPEGPEPGYAPFGGRRRGKSLYHTVGCVACHGTRENPHAGAQPLGPVAEKYTLPSLTAFLLDPLHVRPSGRMPGLRLTPREAADISAYLLPKVPEKPGLDFAYYELNSPNALPDFTKLEPVATGAAEDFDVGKHAKRSDHFGLQYQGQLVVAQAGTYRFHLRSDDGSRLSLNGNTVVDHGGVHGASSKSGEIELAPGRYDVRIDFFERDGGEELSVDYEGPGVSRQSLARSLVAAAPKRPLEVTSFTVQDALARRGRELFVSQGCAACHQVGPRPLPVTPAKPLVALDPVKGCLSAESTRGVDYKLSQAQVAALRTIWDAGLPDLDPERQVQHTMLTFNCVACHARDNLGGVDPALNPHFQTTQQEMGVEGSIPPHLDGVGAKLNPAWLTKILGEGAKDRPYMLTRMPRFGTDNVGHLVDLVGELDKQPALPPLQLARAPGKRAGHRLVGARGFSCIKCHTFGRHKATGVQSIDMTVMTKRLQEDWFRQYVKNPQVYRRGTRMPSAWPPTGKSLLPDVLEGDSDKQIAAVWLYLRDGVRAKTPAGLATGRHELVPTEEAILYRNFIQGAGSRAIGVGYPEGMNMAFDANNLHVAMIWQGGFMDASRHWTGRGQGFQPPAGEKVQTLVPQAAVATLASATAAWPETRAPGRDARFLGYSLTTDQRPTFLYRIDGLTVEDFTNPRETETATTLSRSLTIAGKTTEHTYLRLAAGDLRQDGAWFQVNAELRIKLPAGTAPRIRDVGGSQELLIPLGDGKDERTILLEYAW